MTVTSEKGANRGQMHEHLQNRIDEAGRSHVIKTTNAKHMVYMVN